MEAIYDDIVQPIGLLRFAPAVQARGAMFTASNRAQHRNSTAAVLSEDELYENQG